MADQSTETKKKPPICMLIGGELGDKVRAYAKKHSICNTNAGRILISKQLAKEEEKETA